MIKIKRIYEEKALDDGFRVLVDRLWPRGVSKEKAQADFWLKEVAPNPDLRREFNHQPERFAEFKRLYTEELAEDPEHTRGIQQLLELAMQKDLTLLFAARDSIHNHAVVLQQFLQTKINELKEL